MAPASDAIEVGGASTPTEGATTDPTPEPAPDPRIGELTAERDALAARVADLEAAAEKREGMLRDRSESASQAERDAHMASQAVQEAADDRDAVLADWGREKVQAGVLEALASLRFVSEAAGADFLATVLPKIQAERRSDGAWVAKGPAGLTVVDAVKLEADRRPWLFAASARGGSGTDGSRTPGDSPPVRPGSFEAIKARYQSKR